MKNQYITIGPININKFKTHIQRYLSPIIFKLINIITKRKLLLFKDQYIQIHNFFALEFYAIFLYLYIYEPSYKKFAQMLEHETWIKKVLHPSIKALPLNFSHIEKYNIKLLPHQRSYIEKYAKFVLTYNLRGRILAFEQGLGKTITGISLMLAREKQKVLIVCPKNVINTWKNEFEKYKIEDVYTIDNLPHRSEHIKWLIINYEKLNHPIVSQFVNDNDVGLLIDESHYIKDLNTQRTNNIITLVKTNAQINDIVLISGTPVKGRATEWLPYFIIVDPQIDLKLAQQFSSIFLMDPVLLRHIAHVRMKIYITRELKNNILKDLPKKEIIDLDVKVSNANLYAWENIQQIIRKTINPQKIQEIKNIYLSNWNILQNKLLLKGVNKEDLNTFIYTCIRQDKNESDTYLLIKYIQQWLTLLDDPQDRKNLKLIIKLANNFHLHVYGHVMSTIIQQYRTQCVIDIINNNITTFCDIIQQSTKKTIISGSVITGLKLIKDKLERECDNECVLVVGETPEKERIQNINDFVKKEYPNVLIGSIGVIGVGLTLTAASTMIVLNMPWRYTDFEQVSDRIHRIGQNVPVKIYICKLNTSFLNIHSHMTQIAVEAKTLVDSMLLTAI